MTNAYIQYNLHAQYCTPAGQHFPHPPAGGVRRRSLSAAKLMNNRKTPSLPIQSGSIIK
ncbi:protein of unknown function [Rhodovastum atsumiense]|nr:protein of unknown function [Rhodovastum atsumiense]